MPPKGWKKAGDPPVKHEKVEVKPAAPAAPAVTVVPVAVQKEPKAVLSPIEESREALKQPLPAGQAFFEAPDGYIIVAEDNQDRAFYRAGNGGKGFWINKRRA